MAKIVIFDFDGVIADTEAIHMKAFRKTLAPLGISFSDENYFSRYLALDDKAFFETLLAENGKPARGEAVSALVREKSLLTENEIARCELFEGVDALIRSLASEGFTLAIASGALRKEIEAVLSHAGLLEFFPCIVSAEDCEKCKPDPEPFVRALRGVNLSGALDEPAMPGECLVIEDSVHGIEAAAAAGMRCVAVANSHPREMLSGADMAVDSALQLNAAVLASF